MWVGGRADVTVIQVSWCQTVRNVVNRKVDTCRCDLSRTKLQAGRKREKVGRSTDRWTEMGSGSCNDDQYALLT